MASQYICDQVPIDNVVVWNSFAYVVVLHSFADVVVWHSFADVMVLYSFASTMVLHSFADVVILHSFAGNPASFDVVGDFALSCDVVFIASDVQDKDTCDET